MMEKVTKRLLIRVGTTYDARESHVVPVNSGIPTVFESKIGTFSLLVNITKFDGSKMHQENSCYNISDTQYLNGDAADTKGNTFLNEWEPNLRLHIIFTPNHDIKALNLFFGNDCTVPIRDHIPTIPLATGLKFFSWFSNKSAKCEVYSDKPYLYALAINSFTFMSINPPEPQRLYERNYVRSQVENLNSNENNKLNIPEKSQDRKKYFGSSKHCEGFTFKHGTKYVMQFDTTSLKLADSHYAVSIPTYGSKPFDFVVSSYANEHLNNFNWTIKEGGYDGVQYGTLGMVLNFALLDEEH